MNHAIGQAVSIHLQEVGRPEEVENGLDATRNVEVLADSPHDAKRDGSSPFGLGRARAGSDDS